MDEEKWSHKLTSLIAVQNSLCNTFFRDCSLWPGTSPDSCSFSNSSTARATSGRARERQLVWVNARVGTCGEERGKKFNYINSTAMTTWLEQINECYNENRLSQGQQFLGWECHPWIICINAGLCIKTKGQQEKASLYLKWSFFSGYNIKKNLRLLQTDEALPRLCCLPD